MNVLDHGLSARHSARVVGVRCAMAALLLALGACGEDSAVAGPPAALDAKGPGGDLGADLGAAADVIDALLADQAPDNDVAAVDAGDAALLPDTPDGEATDLQVADQSGDSAETTAVDGAGDVTAAATLCDPCNTDADCGAGSVCAAHGNDGNFCASLCTGACPAGYVCAQIQSPNAVLACVPPTATGQVGTIPGECACSAPAIAAGLSTGCSTVAAAGSCTGKRTCTAAGLSTCDAPKPSAEVCDGLDNDCNGQTDDGSLCEDGNPCTTDACGGTAGCSHPSADGQTCSPSGVFCATGICLAGTCASEIGSGCDDKNVCTTDACDPVTGLCGHTPVAGSCNDGDACTDADACAQGVCVGAATVCDDGNACTVDGCDVQKGCTVDLALDGTACEDGDLCSIGDNCQAGKCATGQAVVCIATQACHIAACDAATGACAASLAADGTACDDGNACTQFEACASGVCGGAGVTCNDQNPCTDDACDPASGCVFSANVSACDDGNACTGPDACADKACAAGSTKVCDDGSPCTADSCDAATGNCLHGAQSGACDDGQVCTGNDECVAGACAGAPLSCDDQNPCTQDTCDAKKGCAHAPTAAASVPCDDGNACTIGDVCTAGACAGAAALDCNDDNVCTDDSCAEKSGCVHVDNTASCSDGNACTTGDTCAGGTCVAGSSTCQCQKTADCAAKEDGDLCNGTLICQGSTCQIDPATIVTCAADANTACSENVCAKATGACAMAAVAQGQPCDDGSACTANDSCKSGTCTGGAAIVCGDNNPCTDDSCDALKGCVYAASSASCNDGSACTSVDTCQDGVCVGVAAQCDDANACTSDGCDAKGGCTHATNTLACEDGNVCTTGDACSAGTCVAGSAKTCDDANGCTTDTCDATQGCLFANNTSTCNDNNVCTSGETCLAGKCQPGALTKICNDNVSCTADSCDPTTGACIFKPIIGCGGNCLANSDCPNVLGGCQLGVCSAATLKCTAMPAPAGTACSTNNACVSGQTCSNFGTCTGGTQKVCDDANPCTADTCQAATGACVFSATNATVCNDQNACTVGDFCSAGACVGGSAKPCNDFNPCTADSCDKASGTCVFTAIAGCASTCKTDSDCAASTDPCLINYCDSNKAACASKAATNLTPCNDKNACSATDICFGGVCQGTAFKTCNDGQLCTTDSCDVATGTCAFAPNTAACSDGDPCTLPDVCAAGACVPGAVKVCSDNNPCTADSCNKQSGNCSFQGIPGCGGYCASNADCPAPQNTCASSSCDLTTKQCTGASVADGTTCNDNNACTSASTCQAGTCIGTGTKVCDDGNACTFDYCSPQSGNCVFQNQGGGNSCSDGNPCTTNDYCQQGSCHAGNAKNCNDGNACTADSCDQASGQCVFAPIAGCGGNCTSNADCPATGNACTTNVCSQMLKKCVVQNVQNQTACDDGLPCTASDYCQSGKCLGGNQKNCSDQNTCTSDSCEAATGNCLHSGTTGGQCYDGSPCTSNDACAAGVCTGTAKSCDDGKPCTADSCSPNSGNCQHQTIQGCGGACTTAADCPKAANLCTPYVCASGTCAIGQATPGTSCSDNNACTGGDTCFAGSCVSGAQKDCSDNNVCTTDNCSQQSGTCTHQNLQWQAQCSDNNLCTSNDHCSGGVCAGNQKTCSDGNQCTADSCSASDGSCLHAAKDCNDNNACTFDACTPWTGNCTHLPIPGC